MSDDLTIPAALDRRAELPADTGSGMANDRAAGAVKPKPSWRDHLPVHPAAELLPLMSEPELRELAEDIKKNGQKYPVVLWNDFENRTEYLLDGRNRLDAMELVGVPLFDKNEHEPLFKWILWSRRDELDPYGLVLSLNVHRRHLTADQRTELVEKVLKVKPEISDRAIAKQTKVDHKTVGKARTKLVSRGEIPHVKTRTDIKGRKQPAAKSRNKGGGHVTSKPAKSLEQKSAEVSVEDRRAQYAAMDVSSEGATEHEQGLRVNAARGFLYRANEAKGLAELGRLKSEDVTDAMIEIAECAAAAWNTVARKLRSMDSETTVDDPAVEILPPEIENSNPIWNAWCHATLAQRHEFVKLNWDDIERERNRAAAHDGAGA